MKEVLILITILIAYRIISRFFENLDTAMHRGFFKKKLTIWTATTTRATYQLVLDRPSGYYLLFRNSFKWGFEKKIMKSYFVPLRIQMIEEKVDPLTYADNIVEDILAYIEEHYGEKIIVSKIE